MSDQPQQPPNLPPPYYFEDDNISFLEILLLLARQLKIILITPTIICTLTIIHVLFIADPIYVSTAKIMSSSIKGVSSMADMASRLGIDFPGGESETKWVYKEIIKSRTLARTMVKRKYDTDEFGANKSLLQILTYGNKEPKEDLNILEVNAVDIFLTMVSISEDLKTGIYTLNLSASEPTLSMELAQSLIEELDRHQQEYNKKITSKTRQFIEERISETKIELEVSEEMLKDFRDRNRRIENSPGLKLEQQRLSREVTVLTGVFTTLKQQLERIKIEEVEESEYVIVIDPPEIPLKRSKPEKKKMVVLAGFFGIGFGMVIGFIKDYFENRNVDDKEKIEEVKKLIQKNVSALIPGKSKS